jgi:hypothetical protein
MEPPTHPSDREEELEEKLEEAKADVIRRCEKAGLKAEESDLPDGTSYLSVAMRNGRETRSIALQTLTNYRRLAAVPFENIVLLGDYAAGSNYAEGWIEAAIRPVDPMLGGAIERRLFGLRLGQEPEPGQKLALSLRSEAVAPGVTIEVARVTPNLLPFLSNYRAERSYTMRLSGLVLSNYDHALNVLQKVSDSLFFQIDHLLNLPLSLQRERPLRFARRRIAGGQAEDIEFPRSEYDRAPVQLYMYARSARNMPLLQFLAYYQAIEFYFPTYSREEASKQIRAILKDPGFRADKDADMGRILSALGSARRGFGNEKEQLLSTLRACVNETSLREFLTGSEELKTFFSSAQKGLTTKKLSLERPDAALIPDVCNLIYDIRCRIVHTKGEAEDGEVELLLPFSKESELLYGDIDLIQFLAQQVLIVASSDFRI